MLVQITQIQNDSLFFCIEDDPLPLNWDGIQRTPWGGTWTGNGAVNVENNYWEFFPDIAGVGEHELFYDNNMCVDSVLMFVYPAELSTDSLTICSAEDPFILEVLPFGGSWNGPGIVNSETGLFDPGLVPGETVTISYSNPTFCSGEMVVVVDDFVQATMAELQDVYCFQDTEIEVLQLPEGGVLTGPEETGIFNPSILGEGNYTYTYGFPENYCSADTSATFSVFPPSSISLTATDTVLCNAEGTTLTALASAGDVSLDIVYEWSDGLFPQSQNVVSPETGQYYYVSVNDGCSDLVTDSIFIDVLEPIALEFIYGDTLCFGEEGGSVSVIISPSSSYSIFWNDEPGAENLTNSAGSIHQLLVVDDTYGCEADEVILIPSYSPIAADFSVNPNSECIPFEANPVGFIDLSQNAISGMWNFGNGDSLLYTGSSPESTYTLPGFYTITLAVENEGGCLDSATQTICVSDPSVIFIPDVFSPNDDGNNDVLFVRGGGILNLELNIYNRWGDRVFKTTDIDEGWDGYVMGNKAPTGVYIYQLTARTENGIDVEQSGDITLVR